MKITEVIDDVLGGELPIRIEAYDGSSSGSTDARATLVIKSPDALNHILFGGTGEIGLARAYVSGALEIEGDLMVALSLASHFPEVRVRPQHLQAIAKILGRNARRLPPPPEESRRYGRLHTLGRDKAIVQYHYDVSNRFYELILDSSLTYSCAVWEDPDWTLELAQAAKHELVLRKLNIGSGDRLLEIGCGWGSHLVHAAKHFGVHGVGLTTSHAQAELARKRVAETGVGDLVEIREQDYRDLDGEHFDAVSSIGMFEHVGIVGAPEYFETVTNALKPGGRALIQAITTRELSKRPLLRPDFLRAYIFPDGELVPHGTMADEMQRHALEVQHIESLRQHYGPTLQVWLANLETNWDECVAEAGLNRTRLWRLYLAGTATNFSGGRLQVHQILASKNTEDGSSSFPSRPDWDASNLDRFGG